jgi:hypothetical protein
MPTLPHQGDRVKRPLPDRTEDIGNFVKALSGKRIESFFYRRLMDSGSISCLVARFARFERSDCVSSAWLTPTKRWPPSVIVL